jgi:hypothetical protein
MTDAAATYEALRASTAEMLKLDPANLSLVEGLQLDLIALLRLTTSDMHGAALSGEAVDLDRLSTALGMLQKLLPASALVAPAPADVRGDSDAAFRQIADQLDRQIAVLEVAMARDPARARAEFEEKLQRAIEKHCGTGNKSGIDSAFARNTDPDPSGGGAARNTEIAKVAKSVPRDLAAAGSEPPLLIEPPSPPPPPKRESDLERMARVNAQPVPSRYLRQDEEWRRHIDGDGNIVSPWFNPHG